ALSLSPLGGERVAEGRVRGITGLKANQYDSQKVPGCEPAPAIILVFRISRPGLRVVLTFA
ncbi:MAG: hypothetical protein ACLP7I_10410, partial [Limisphaerales bacterium]